jgi:hypothetical protein
MKRQEAEGHMEDGLVTVHTAIYLHDAEFMKSVLEAEGIEAVIPDAFTVGVDPALSVPLGGIRVQVAQPDAERAAAALRAVVDRAAGQP